MSSNLHLELFVPDQFHEEHYTRIVLEDIRSKVDAKLDLKQQYQD